MLTRTTLLALAVLLAGCASDASPPGDPPTTTVTPAGDVTRFIVIGDMGTGMPAQYQVAAAVESVCVERGCDFAIGMGDNIYETGVTSATDPQFETKFETPYRNLSFPFFMSLGNHDNGGGRGHDSTKGDLQVDYAQRNDRASDKWRMPARHYAFSWGSARFLALDTNTLAVLGDPLFQQDAGGERQIAWAKAELRREATWRFTFGHHPYLSNGGHGNAGEFDGVPSNGLLVKKLFEDAICDRADVAFSGHDHNLQWIEPVPGCGKTEFLVSGAGAKKDGLESSKNRMFWGVGDSLGFAWVRLEGDRFTGAFYDGEARLLFERSFQRQA